MFNNIEFNSKILITSDVVNLKLKRIRSHITDK
jgi:hypothetical protein